MNATDNINKLENDRIEIQHQLDQQKSAADRNRLGQFATPHPLATDIVRYGLGLLPKRRKISFLDPAIGTGAFYSALRLCCPNGRVKEAHGFEVDPHYGLPSARLWNGSGVKIELADFTQQKGDPRFNLIICNPPYVRHHHLDSKTKARLKRSTFASSGMSLSGLAGLYCYFLGQSHAWMAAGGIAGWLIPSEFMDVNYGAAIKDYLLNRVTLLRIHRFDPADVQFADALVSSAIVWIRNATPQRDHRVEFSFGGTLANPHLSRLISARDLESERKWTRFPAAEVRDAGHKLTLGDMFKIKRGVATGGNEFFILSDEEARKRRIPGQMLRPILPSPRYLSEDLIEADENGNPILEKMLFLLDTRMTESEIEEKHPTLWQYLQLGKEAGVHRGYLCRHRPLWYAQEERPPAPIVCTYLGRKRQADGRAFRFIRNRSRATVANVYLAMYPTGALQTIAKRDPGLIDKIWRSLNAIDVEHLLSEGRVYGGGLHKLEPRELASVPLAMLCDTLNADERSRIIEPHLFASIQ